MYHHLKALPSPTDRATLESMNVTYAVPIELDTTGGNVQHVLGICRHAAKAGVNIHLVCLQGQGKTPLENFRITTFPSKGLTPFKRITSFCAQALALIGKEPKPDWVYFRPFPMDFFYFSRYLASERIPFAYELNTLWAEELRSQNKPFKAWLYPYAEKLSIRKASALLPVTNEIADYARKTTKRIPSFVAGNGIEIPPLPIATASDLRRKWSLPSDKKLILMAGFTRPWHGHEKLIATLRFLPTEWNLVLVGSESSEMTKTTLQQSEAHSVQERVHVLPWLTHQEVDELIYACHIGVSPLALEAKKMKEAQSLKVRHYLSLGMPVVIAGGEAKNILEQPFVVQVEKATPENLSLALQKLDKDFDRDLIRDFAKRELSWEAVARKTWDFLSSIRVG